MVVCGGVWWFAVVCGGLRWFVVDCGGLSFSHTAGNAPTTVLPQKYVILTLFILSFKPHFSSSLWHFKEDLLCYLLLA